MLWGLLSILRLQVFSLLPSVADGQLDVGPQLGKKDLEIDYSNINLILIQ